MGFDRFLANVMTFGATNKVLEAKESYSAVASKYNKSVEKLEKLKKRLPVLRDEVLSDLKSLNKDKHRIKAILKDQNLLMKLKEDERNALRQYNEEVNLQEDEFERQCETFYDTVWFDTAEDNIAACIATIVLPVIGVFAAHCSADETIKKMNVEKAEIMKNMQELNKSITELSKVEARLTKQSKALKIIKNVLKYKL